MATEITQEHLFSVGALSAAQSKLQFYNKQKQVSETADLAQQGL